MAEQIVQASIRLAAVRIAAAGWFSAAALYLASEAAAALAFSPPYSYARNYISDLGVPVCGAVFDGRPICSPLHAVMNAGFVLQGALFLAAALAVARAISAWTKYALVAFAAINGVGIGLVGLYPETAAVPSGGLHIHASGAFLAIVAGNLTALVSTAAFTQLGLPRLHRLASVTLPILAAGALAMLLVARARGTAIVVPDGVWERTSVYTITAWELLTAACLLARAKAVRREGGLP